MRCSWVDEKCAAYVRYHDEEWGKPVHEDCKLFEMLILEGFQAGLSWLTVLKKRQAFRKEFADFEPQKVAFFDDVRVEKMLQNSQIIRSRLKIVAAINNAKVFLQIQQEFGSFAKYLWHFTDGKIMRYKNFEGITHNELSDTISKDLKKRGMKYVGSVIIYSYLQAVGVINDHEPQCFCHENFNHHD